MSVIRIELQRYPTCFFQKNGTESLGGGNSKDCLWSHRQNNMSGKNKKKPLFLNFEFSRQNFLAKEKGR